jgi:hypothetical protein
MHTRRAEGLHEKLLEASVALFVETDYQRTGEGTGVKGIVEHATMFDLFVKARS